MSILPNLNAVRVLIVDDDLRFAERTNRALTRAGYYVQNAYNCGDALFAVETTRFDVALVNSAMRDRDGRAVNELIAAHATFNRIPLVSFGERDPRTRYALTPRPTSEEELLRYVAQAVRAANRQPPSDPIRATQTDIGPIPIMSETALDARLQQQLAELKTLSVLGRSLSSSLELSEVLNQIVDAATSLTEAEEGLLLLPDEAGAALYIRAMKGLDNESARNFRIKTDDTLAGRVFTTGEPILIGARGWQKVKTEYFVRSLLYVPLSYKGQVIGVLGVNNRRAERVFTAHDQELLVDLAAHATIALANARLYESQVSQTRQLATLVEAGRAVNSTLALDGVLSSICQQIIRALNVSGCLISELIPGETELRTLAMARRSVWLPDQGTMLALNDRPVLKSAIDQNAYYDIASDRSDTRWAAEHYLLNRSGAERIVVLPLLPGGQPLGVLELHYLGNSPDVTPDFRRQARTTALEICAAVTQRTAYSTNVSAFLLAQNILTQTGADWCVLSLIETDHLTRVLEYGDAVWLGTLRPTEPIFPPTLAAFEQGDIRTFTSRADHLPNSVRDSLKTYGAEAMLCLRLTVKGTPIGAMTLYDVSEARHFSEQEISLAQAMVSQAATAIENARLFHDLDTSLTELKNTQIRLVQAARLSAMGELAAAVAHQINNPLTTVLAETEMLMQDMSEDNPQREPVSAVHRAGKRAHTVVRRLLSTARRGSADDRPELINVNETIRSTLDLVTSHIQRGRVTLQVDLEDDTTYVVAIAGQLEDVWLNLLLNAHDAVLGTPKAQVAISARREGDRVRVNVVDNGHGISSENQGKIFEPFFTTKPVGEGTGLGLYICKQIIDSIHGKIELESAPDKGTRFTVNLPLQMNEIELE